MPAIKQATGEDVNFGTKLMSFLITPAVFWIWVMSTICNRWFFVSFGPHDTPTPKDRLDTAADYIVKLEGLVLAVDRVVTDTPLPSDDEDALYAAVFRFATAIRENSPLGKMEADMRASSAANDSNTNKES